MGNVIDLAAFKKTKSIPTKVTDTFATQPELDNRIQRIKESIQRINSLMQSLKSTNEPPINQNHS